MSKNKNFLYLVWLRLSRLRIYILAGVCAVVIISALVFTLSLPPASFARGTLVQVKKNDSLNTVAAELADVRVVKSAFMFRIVSSILSLSTSGKRSSVTAGDYFFPTSENVWVVAYRLAHNEQGITPTRVTFPEGVTVRDMGNILATDLTTASNTLSSASTTISNTTLTSNPSIANSTFTFNKKEFLTLASTSEGYLFPDTYFFLPNETPVGVIADMKNNFIAKMATLSSEVIAFQTTSVTSSKTLKLYPRTSENIITMASILEKEATDTVDRQIIAGILWKRLDAGMPLQVDPPFFYILGKTSANLTVTDLATSSPYNTYVHTGLPPTPIDNPGLDALSAAITPITTPYWYYVSDKVGTMHYAETYVGHEANRAKYVE